MRQGNFKYNTIQDFSEYFRLDQLRQNNYQMYLTEKYGIDSVRDKSKVWKPIETAPKDNVRKLYLARFDKQGNLLELDYNGGWEYWEESFELSHINGYFWASEKGIEEPTHWAYQDGPPPTV